MHPRLELERLRFLRRIHDPRLARAALWLFGYTMIPTTLVSALYAGLGGAAPDMEWLPALTFNPFIETLVLGAVIIQLGRQHGEHKAAALAAALMAGFHALNNLYWGLAGIGLFAIHAYAFAQLYHEDRQRAFVVPMLAHALHNGVVMAMLAAWRAW